MTLSISVKMLSYFCTSNANRSHVSLKSTFSKYYALFCYLSSADSCTSLQPKNFVDVNWTVTVIIRFRLASELNVNYIAYSYTSAPLWMRTTAADRHKFLAVRHLSQILLNGRKTHFLPISPAFCTPVGGNSIRIS